MKTATYIWAIGLLIFALICAVSYFTFFYWHLGFFTVITGTLSYIFFSVAKDEPAKL